MAFFLSKVFMKQEKLNELLLKENNDIISHYILFRNQDLE